MVSEGVKSYLYQESHFYNQIVQVTKDKTDYTPSHSGWANIDSKLKFTSCDHGQFFFK